MESIISYIEQSISVSDIFELSHFRKQFFMVILLENDFGSSKKKLYLNTITSYCSN